MVSPLPALGCPWDTGTYGETFKICRSLFYRLSMVKTTNNDMLSTGSLWQTFYISAFLKSMFFPFMGLKINWFEEEWRMILLGHNDAASPNHWPIVLRCCLKKWPRLFEFLEKNKTLSNGRYYSMCGYCCLRQKLNMMWYHSLPESDLYNWNMGLLNLPTPQQHNLNGLLKPFSPPHKKRISMYGFPLGKNGFQLGGPTPNGHL